MKDILSHKNVMYVLIILILYTCIALLFNRIKSSKQEISVVDNYSRFYTLANSANMYLSYLGLENSKNVYTLLNDDYITENQITEDNVIAKLKDFETTSPSIRVTKMLQQTLNKRVKKYYIKGNLIDISEDTYDVIKDYYLIMEVDENNNTYKITPYDGKIFMEEKYE